MNKLSNHFLHHFIVQWLISFFICLIVHIPYFLGKHCSFDGDEAIVGIMAQDLLQGKNFPVYFYGQQYGLSFFEVVGVALSIIFLGNSVWSLKIGSILVFSIGLAFLSRFFQKNNVSFFWIIVSIIILSCFPAWMIWSAKARGGYVTAFSAACILFYITQIKKPDLKWIIISSLILVICVHSQLFISIPVLFLFIPWVLRSKKIHLVICGLISCIIFYIVFKIPGLINSNYWTLPLSNKYNYKSFALFNLESYKVVLGYFYYEMTFKPTKAAFISGFSYYLMAAVVCVSFLFTKNKSYRAVFVLLMVGALVSYLMIMWMRIPTYRYLLGSLTACMFILVFALKELSGSRLKYILLLFIPFAFGISFTGKNIPDTWMVAEGNQVKMYNELISELHKRDIKAVYCTDGLVQWMLCYSGIPSRYVSKHERIDRFVIKTDAALNDPASKVAIVGYNGFFNYMDTGDWYQKVILLNKMYFIYEEPSRELLIQGGFEFE